MSRTFVPDMSSLAANLSCCASNSYDWIQLSGHGEPGVFVGQFSRQQLLQIKDSRLGGGTLKGNLKDIDDALREAARVAPNIEVYACNFGCGPKGESTEDLMKELYGFSQVRGGNGSCFDFGPFEIDSGININKKKYRWLF